MLSPISNNIGKFVTYMTKNDALAPVIALEATVTGGRTLQAYKRGGEDEARERFIEEGTGAIVWLGGVKVLNDYVGDPLLKKMFGENFDVGTDKVLRTPFDNFMKEYSPKKFSKEKVAMIKATKVLASVLIADAFIGLVVPPLNHKLTRTLKAKKQAKLKEEQNKKIENSSNKQKDLTFKSSFSAINSFTNAIENTNTGKLLSTDAGLVSGRIYSARNNDERREIAIRDIGSIYFYMWAQKHVGKLVNFVESGKFSRLNPNSTKILDSHLAKFLEQRGGEMAVEEFRKAVLGDKVADIKYNIEFESGELSVFTKFMDKIRNRKTEPLKVVEVSKLETIITDDKELLSRIKEMSNLQPLRQGQAVVTKQQILDAMNKAEINNPKLLDEVFNEFSEGAHKNKFKFISNDELYALKSEMEDYINDLCKKSKDGKINKKALDAARRRNLTCSGINFAAGFVVAAAFLSTLIPKFQYWVTKQKTGKNEFPGIHDSNGQLIADA